MNREDFRRELRDGFESISGPPDPALSARVHSALVEAPERRSTLWVAGLAATLIAVLIVGALFLAGPLRHQPVVPSGILPSPTPLPSVQPSATQWTCTSVYVLTTPGQGPAVAYVDAVRTGTHAGYDRITIEFKNGVPGDIRLAAQDNTTFTQGASGRTVSVQGSAGLLVTIDGADEHTDYTGSTDFVTAFPVLQEARQVQDFEGVVQWGLGLSHAACYHAYFLQSPWRLVIDIQNT